jgi:NhaC family Na+:H+ antiporter
MSGLIIASVAALTLNLLVAAPAIFRLRGASVDPEGASSEPREASLSLAVLPLTLLMALLCVNVVSFGDETLSGPNQIALLISAGVAALIARGLGQDAEALWGGVKRSISDTLEAILILLVIGALAGTWMLSGVVPTMIDLGLQLMSPSYFLIATCALCALVSLASGSSWSTIATVGVALIGVGSALGFSPGLCAGAIISGAYFGDKMSPLSDTTNLAPAMAGGSLIPHIRAMLWTTAPAFAGALIIFGVMGLGTSAQVDSAKVTALQEGLRATLWIHPILLLVPVSVAALIALRAPTLVTLTAGVLLGGLAAALAQPDLLSKLAGESGALGMFKVITSSMSMSLGLTNEAELSQALASSEAFQSLSVDDRAALIKMLYGKLLTGKGMAGMLGTVWLIICALTFGGVMERSGFLAQISRALLSRVQRRAGLVTATATTSVFLNVTASDQYLAIVVPGRMYQQRFADAGLAPEALSRTLEDAGTVTSVLVPWNTCGATQASVLGVATVAYLPYCFFNWLSPIITILFAQLGWRQPLLASAQVALSDQGDETREV